MAMEGGPGVGDTPAGSLLRCCGLAAVHMSVILFCVEWASARVVADEKR